MKLMEHTLMHTYNAKSFPERFSRYHQEKKRGINVADAVYFHRWKLLTAKTVLRPSYMKWTVSGRNWNHPNSYN